MRTGHRRIYLIFKLFTCSLESRYHFPHLINTHIVIIFCGRNHQRPAKLCGISDRRTASIFLRILCRSLSYMIRSREKIGVRFVVVLKPVSNITDRHSRITACIFLRIFKNVHKSYHSTMAPTNQTHSCGVYNGVVRDHIITCRKHILVLKTSVIYGFVKTFSVTCTTSIIWSHNYVPLSQHFSYNLIVGAPKSTVYSSMRKDQKRILISLHSAARNKYVRIKGKRITYELVMECISVLLLPVFCRSSKSDFGYVSNIAQTLIDEHILKFLLYDIHIVSTLGKERGGKEQYDSARNCQSDK